MITPFNTCLLIDDNPLDNFINSKILERNNFAKVIIVSQYPDEAISLLREGKIKPDVIFLDIRMPIMDGFQFLGEYDKIDSDKSLTKIFMLSSSINPIDLAEAANNKYIAKYITKALTPEILATLLT